MMMMMMIVPGYWLLVLCKFFFLVFCLFMFLFKWGGGALSRLVNLLRELLLNQSILNTIM